MFTKNTIELSTASQGLELIVQRDGLFSYVGKLKSKLDRRVVPAMTPEHIEFAIAHEGIVGVITRPEYAALVPKSMSLGLAKDPVSQAYHLHEKLCDIDGFIWQSFDTRIDPSAKIHPSAVIAERDVIIGPEVVVGPTSVILERSVLENNIRLGVGVVVGLDAFEIFEQANPRRILRQAGGVWIESGATILAKCTLVRATFGGFTRICRNAMVDVLVYVAHDSVLGQNSTVVACAEISGRCELGEGAYIGPNACIRNGVVIGKNARVSMGSVVTQDVPDGEVVSGNFAVPHNTWLAFVKSLAAIDRES